MFFVANGNVRFKDKNGLQQWIDEAIKGFHDERLVKHLNKLASVECKREIEHDYKFWNLINSLDVRRQRLLPSMDTRLLFANMNAFGKMLLVLMHNCSIMTKKGLAEGRWFDVDYVGPNMWKFQITSSKERTFDSLKEMSLFSTQLESRDVSGKYIRKEVEPSLHSTSRRRLEWELRILHLSRAGPVRHPFNPIDVCTTSLDIPVTRSGGCRAHDYSSSQLCL
ncbi:hypothetical protein Pcinc_010794 [Petrolisthes cinctipes]|uniref:Uncharacterized protein n=1 Tax=Petrolisthes cinctipes TaxID=88211 RepID=A0AAE1G423_PETCI|nr:hypothetical protein Pcinc_010794 [Petrolisthes cinctipes]